MTSSKHLYALANAGADKATLLAAINNAVSGLDTKAVNKGEQMALLRDRNVHNLMARDLKSNAGDLQVDRASEQNRQTADAFERGKALLSQRGDDKKEADLRSLRSEYDYNNKKTFVDVLGAPKNPELTSQRLNNQMIVTNIDKARRSVRGSSCKETAYMSMRSSDLSKKSVRQPNAAQILRRKEKE